MPDSIEFILPQPKNERCNMIGYEASFVVNENLPINF